MILVAAMTATAGAENLPSGDWIVNVDDPTNVFAGTSNGADQVLMQICDPEEGQCFYAVGFGLRCKEGDTHPALLNTDVEAASVELLCGTRLKDGTNLMYLKDFDQIDGLLRTARKVGFALPMEGDQFKAVRFSLKGSVTAIDAMRRVAQRGTRSAPEVEQARDSEVF